ncbi:MAG: DEAD/DEAH box helicase, partial [Actinobacteria bacterium]|nr:DEAD/DEAH box helicase [Actinomycetota bacterium]
GIDDFGDSDQEMQFIEWMNQEWPEAIRWVVPQPSFDQLLKSRGVQAESCRRCDFLISPPDNSPFVVEIDGIQHGDQSLLDEERDAHLASIGIQTIRVSTSEMRAGKGKNLEKISDLISGIPAASDIYLESVWSPIQTHRLLLALVEGCARGFLAGKRWVVRVEDPTGHAAELLGPYLAVLFALDKLWGQCGVAPESVTVENEGIWLGQYEALSEVLEGRDCTVLLPTGAGKSIIYQLAGLCLPGRTLVIDPLTALIEDQLNGLRLHGIDRVVGLSSQTTRMGIGKQLLDEVSNADAYFTFISPERLKIQAFRSALREMTSLSPVNLVVVDEAHCVSEWGHDFRTAYLGLGDVVRETCKDSAGVPPPLLALTGTASRAVLKDVLFQLGMVERTANSIVRPKTFDRKELNFQIRLTTPESSTAELKGVLKSLPGLFGESSQDFFEPNGEDTYAGLIFCPTGNGYHGIVTTSEEVKSIIPSHRIYAGKKPKSLGKINWDNTKRRNAELFKGNEITALVTTIAFGMGIDKPNIRWVVHYGLPKS